MRPAPACWAAALLLLCAACAPTGAEPTPTVGRGIPDAPPPTPSAVEVTPTPTPSTTPTPEPGKQAEGIAEETYGYQYGGVTIQVKYPYLPEDDPALSDLLRREALDFLTQEDGYDLRRDLPPEVMGYVEQDWTAPRSDGALLSILFRGESCFGGPTGRDCWGVTQDRKTGQRLSLGDLVDTGEDFEAWLHAQDWTALDHWRGGGEEIGKDRAYIEFLLPFYVEYLAGPAESIDNFYLTDTDLVIIVWEYFKYPTRLSVPLVDLTLKGDTLWNG